MPSTSSASRPASSRASWIASTAVSEIGRPMSLAKGRWPMPTIATRSWMRRKRSSPGSCTVIRLPRDFATAQMRPDLAGEFGDRVEQLRAREDVVVAGAGDAQEALRLARRSEQALAECEGHDLVAIAVRDEDRDGDRPDARERVEAIADEGRQRSIVAAGDVPERRPRRDDGDAGARAHARQVDRDGTAERFAEADDRQVPGAVVGRLGIEIDAGLARPALAAPVAAVVVGQHVDAACGERERDVDASGDVPGVAVRPDERGPRVARRDVPRMYTDVVAGGDPALLDARRRA